MILYRYVVVVVVVMARGRPPTWRRRRRTESVVYNGTWFRVCARVLEWRKILPRAATTLGRVDETSAAGTASTTYAHAAMIIYRLREPL